MLLQFLVAMKSYEIENPARTMVIGSFIHDSERDVITAWIEKHVITKADETVEEIYAYAFGSIGLVRFQTADLMLGLSAGQLGAVSRGFHSYLFS